MECKNCGYKTDNKKSFSNHIRYGCPIGKKSKECCKFCGELKPKRKPSEEGLFCNNKCYSLWRSKNLLGKKSPNYKDGKCNKRLLLRARLKFKIWRKAVFQRDNYVCQKCGDNKGGNLQAHHIKSFSKYPRLRYKLTNGITLCGECHKKTENYGYKKSGN